MKPSFLRATQWLFIAVFVTAIVGLNFEFNSEAGKTTNTSPEDSIGESLLGYWKMDTGSGTSAVDSSGRGNDLSMTGSPSWTTGQIGPYALDFSGTGQYLSVASPASGILDFVNGASFSITGWFNRDTFAADHTIVAKRNGQAATDDGYIVYIDDSTDTLVFEASDTADGDEYQRVSSSTFTAAGWHQFAVTWNDSATTDPVNIYIDGGLNNGTATGTFANIGSLVESVAFRIGAESDAGNLFDGRIDDIRVYGRALSANDVFRLAQTTAPTDPNTSLVGHWTFDGNDVVWGDTGTEIKDVSGNNNHGAVGGLTRSSVTPGKLGQGLSFNGSSDYVNFGSLANTQGVSRLTISAWWRENTLSGGVIVSSADITSPNWYFSGSSVSFGGTDDIEVVIGGGGAIGYTTSGTHQAEVWEHWVFVFDGSLSGNSNRLKLYKDGAQQTLTFFGTIPAITGSGDKNTFVGSYDGVGYFLNGKTDDVRIYNRALSSGEILNLYNVGK